MPITTQACPGVCNRAARKAWDAYDEDAAAYPSLAQAYEKAYRSYRAHLAWWHPPLVDPPIEPARPARPEPPTMPVALANPVWCDRCPRIIREALAEVDDTAAVLAAAVDGHRGAAIAGPNGVRPLDHRQIVDELDDLYGFLVTVEDAWRRARRYPPRPRRARGAHARSVSVAWLLGVLDDILLDPWSVDVGLGILRWHRVLLRMTKSDPASRRSPISCPRCREPQVRRRDDGYFECTTCGRLLNQKEHDREFSEQAEQREHQEAQT